jgi:hypothetical protein
MRLHQLVKLLLVCSIVGTWTLASPSLAQREGRGGQGGRGGDQRGQSATPSQRSMQASPRSSAIQATPRSSKNQSSQRSVAPLGARRDVGQSDIPKAKSSDGQNTARTFRQNDTSQSDRDARVARGINRPDSSPREQQSFFRGPTDRSNRDDRDRDALSRNGDR